MYFLIGGRKTQSGLYRLTYVGKESTAPASAHQANGKERELRHQLEALHVGEHPDAVDKAWPYLNHSGSLHSLRRSHRHRASAAGILADSAPLPKPIHRLR